MGPYLSVFSSSFLVLLSIHGQLTSSVQTFFLSWLTSRASIRFALDGNIPKSLTPCALASLVSTMVEPLLSTHALAGAKKQDLQSCIMPVKVLGLCWGGTSASTWATLSATFPHNLHRTSNSPSPLCRAS